MVSRTQITSSEQTGPEPIASRESHDKLIGLVNAEPCGKVLDAMCGRGAIGARLQRLGFDVAFCDIDSGLFELDGAAVGVVDLNEGELPWPDATFDYVVCANGLHRLFNPSNALKEFHRCLKPGGKLFASIPNYASLWRRVMFLFLGSRGNGIDRATFTQVTDRPEAHFRQNLTFPAIEHHLKSQGFGNVWLFGSPMERMTLLMSPLYLLIRTGCIACPSAIKTKYSVRKANSASVLLGGSHIHICASR